MSRNCERTVVSAMLRLVRCEHNYLPDFSLCADRHRHGYPVDGHRDHELFLIFRQFDLFFDLGLSRLTACSSTPSISQRSWASTQVSASVLVGTAHAAHDAAAQADAQIFQRHTLEDRFEETLHDDALGLFASYATHHQVEELLFVDLPGGGTVAGADLVGPDFQARNRLRTALARSTAGCDPRGRRPSAALWAARESCPQTPPAT